VITLTQPEIVAFGQYIQELDMTPSPYRQQLLAMEVLRYVNETFHPGSSDGGLLEFQNALKRELLRLNEQAEKLNKRAGNNHSPYPNGMRRAIHAIAVGLTPDRQSYPSWLPRWPTKEIEPPDYPNTRKFSLLEMERLTQDAYNQGVIDATEGAWS